MKTQELGLTTLVAFVLWTGCLAVGVTGLALPHRLPPPPRADPPPIVATMLNVTISNSPASPAASPAARPPSDDPALPPPPALQSPSAAPPLQAIVERNPKVAFALPTKPTGNMAVTPRRSAAPPRISSPPTAASATANSTPQTGVQHLVFGEGAGQQPAPEYPREAALAGDEGTVIVQFTVDADGRVDSAFAKTPCRSEILNSAAIQTIRHSWRFKAGHPMTYDISIVFQLNDN